MFLPELLRDARSHELQFSTTHLGHFQLTRALLPALRAAGGARVVTVTSGAAQFGEIRWDDLDFATGYDPAAAYGQSKRANVLFTVELDRRYADQAIRAFAAHPSVVIGPGPFSPEREVAYRAQGLVDEDGATIIDPEGGKRRPSSRAPRRWSSALPARCWTASAGSTSRTATSPCSTTRRAR
jgi:NAD(P)-dependent dehydrogenase (short-subunit alcohol dehydrogenase family)